MFYSEMIAVCSEIRTIHKCTVCVQNVKVFNIIFNGTLNNHWAVYGNYLRTYEVNKFLFIPSFYSICLTLTQLTPFP
jgi:hypothetical protein